MIKEILKKAIEKKASDIHLTVGSSPILRVNGKIENLNNEKLSVCDIEKMVEVLLENQNKETNKYKEIDFSFHLNEGDFDHRFRTNIYYQRGSKAIALRIIPHRIPQLEELGVPLEIKNIAFKSKGLFLVTGPTGSGKSTTLASLINFINKNKRKHIITLEDPIEYVHRHNKSIVNQRSINDDTNSFQDGLRSALRQDPDVIMIGELRDLETVSTAITAAETGHLVLATLHTNSASQTIERIVDMFPPYQQNQIRVQFSLTILGILCQNLIVAKNNNDRVLATELMLSNAAIRNQIRDGKSFQINSTIQTNKIKGMHLMEESLNKLYKNDLINKEEYLTRSTKDK